MSPNTCIKFCILSLCILSLMWIHLQILESDFGHLAAYTWLNAHHERQKLEWDFEQDLPDEEDDDEAFVS
jgi:hypothetical protein